MKSSLKNDKNLSPKNSLKSPTKQAMETELQFLREENKRYAHYIREKTNQLLHVMGTLPLRSEEFDDRELLTLDPIGIIAGSFEQVLEYLNETINDLGQAKDELQTIFDATGVGISIIDQNFCIVKFNEKQRELLVDANLQNVTGRYCYDVYCNKKEPGIDCPAHETFATGRAVMVREVRKKNKYFQVISTPFTRDNKGNVNKVIEVSLDITAKRLAEQEEKRQRDFYLTEKLKLATVIKSLSEGLLVTNADAQIVSVNDAAMVITEKSEAELLGTDIDHHFNKRCKEAEKKSLRATNGFHNLEIRYQIKDKEKIISLSAALLTDMADIPIGRVFTFRDITEEKSRQEAYHRAEKLAAIGQLSAGLAHELNTPLGSILGYSRLLLRHNNFSDQQRERLEIIAEQAQKSSVIINGLLNFARISTHSTNQDAKCEANDIINEALKVLATEFDKRNIVIETALKPVPEVAIDAKQFEQVILNILLNSLQAMKGGGTIIISTTSSGNRLQVTISDTGPGIAHEIQSRIFDPFFTTKEVGEGTGLGLSICSGIINDFGGAIDLMSDAGQGTTFTITLPLEPTHD